MYVKDVEDRSNTPKGCNAMYVEDVEDRSNTPKGCNAMYVEDVEDGKRTYMCCMSKMGKEHTHTCMFFSHLRHL